MSPYPQLKGPQNICGFQICGQNPVFKTVSTKKNQISPKKPQIPPPPRFLTKKKPNLKKRTPQSYAPPPKFTKKSPRLYQKKPNNTPKFTKKTPRPWFLSSPPFLTQTPLNLTQKPLKPNLTGFFLVKNGVGFFGNNW